MMATFFHWRLNEGARDAFLASWAMITDALKEHGSLGSTLFEDEDGTVRALARWPDQATRDRAFDRLQMPEAVDAMQAAVAETLLRVDCVEIDNRWTLKP